MQASILFVEDEAELRMTVGDRLRGEQYVVEEAATGREALEKATRLPFDLIILDLMLPDGDGMDICRDIRKSGLITPILMLTARGQTSDKVAGLKIGADDYVTKPFDMSELMARVEALLRRAPSRYEPRVDVVRLGSIAVDRRGTRVTRDGAPVKLSAREFQLLLYFIDNPGVTVTRETLLTQVWGYSASMYTRTVDVHVASLRQKLEQDPKSPKLFETVPKVGYRFSGAEG
jgi:two-component system alkaline phosphatase synthesis response regulator PhoP